jgi:hypothetical protein
MDNTLRFELTPLQVFLVDSNISGVIYIENLPSDVESVAWEMQKLILFF